MATILGFNGKIGSGKTTAASKLHEIVGPARAGHVEFSDAMLALGNDWMSRIGWVNAAGPREVEMLRAAASERYGITVSAEQAARLDVGALAGYLAARQSLPVAERAVVLDNKEAHRPLLQWLGHQMMTHVDRRFWSRTVEATVSAERDMGKHLVTVGGVRHPEDADTIHGLHGLVLEVVRPDVSHELQTHLSEGGLPPERVDVQIHNDDGLLGLQRKMEQFWTDLQAGTPSRLY